MKRIKLTKGKYTTVDDGDFDMLNQFPWYYTSNGYAAMHYDGICVLMHRLIMGPGSREVVDHLNHDKLDNQRRNLKVCTQQVNTFNHKSLSKFNRSGHRGISWDKVNNKWRATIKWNQKQISLGRHDTLELAKAARQKAEQELLWSA